VTRVAIVTDSASDLTPQDVRAGGITVVPLEVSFGSERYRAGVDLTTEQFWERMLAPDAPFPSTAAASPGEFRDVFESCFAAGAGAVVCVDVAGTLSATLKSAQIARDMLLHREIHIVDSRSASMGVGLLAQLGVELAAEGRSAAEIAKLLDQRTADIDLYVAIDTLEYLRKGGRISGARAAIGGLLSMKPIITVRDGHVTQADRIRTKSKARERCLELLTARPVERIAVLHTMDPDVEAFRDELSRRVPGGIDPAKVSIQPIGASVGPHLGPGCVGAVVLFAR
jgi:DegV family protein with EDD domain